MKSLWYFHVAGCESVVCCGLTPTGNSTPHNCLLTPPPTGLGRESLKSTSRKINGLKYKTIKQIKKKPHLQEKQNKELVFKYSMTLSEPPHLAVHISHLMQQKFGATPLPQIPDSIQNKSCY